jgi:phosphoribosyl 1,2-cyclic phosphate phosphodiesterase
MRPARVIFLGTGTSHGVPMIGCGCAVCTSADPRDRRLRPSIYLDVAGGPGLLVDTATDLRQQALAHQLRRVDALLYTHSHADHVMGIDEMRRFNALRRGPIPVFADPPTAADLRRMFRYAFSPPRATGGGVPELALIEIAGPFEAAGVPVVPVPLLHGEQPILGFRFGRFAYLTDCSVIPEPSFALLTGLDVVVIDALRHRKHPTHFSIAEATAAARRIAARQTYFTHICHDLPHAETSGNLPAGMALAHDGLVLEVDLTPPGGGPPGSA